MSKPYTANDFSSNLSTDRTWRIKEISDLKSAIRRADSALQKVLLRAHVTICYAHWEGHVKLASKQYLTHVALRKFDYKDLNSQFLKNLFLPRLGALARSKSSVGSRCELLDEIFSASSEKFTRVDDELVNTKSNLNSEVLFDICLVCGLDPSVFKDDGDFIDSILLKRRNAIAHGEDTFIALNDLDEISARTIKLMRAFGDCLDNVVQLQSYKVA